MIIFTSYLYIKLSKNHISNIPFKPTESLVHDKQNPKQMHANHCDSLLCCSWYHFQASVTHISSTMEQKLQCNGNFTMTCVIWLIRFWLNSLSTFIKTQTKYSFSRMELSHEPQEYQWVLEFWVSKPRNFKERTYFLVSSIFHFLCLLIFCIYFYGINKFNILSSSENWRVNL